MTEDQQRCPSCYDSFSGPWCDSCDTWPCLCVTSDELRERAQESP